MKKTTKYNFMENVLQDINQRFISLEEDEVVLNNQVLHAVLEVIIKQMKKDDLLFKFLYQEVFYGGSYFDGLKVGEPEEFDLDLLLVVPKCAKPQISKSDLAGYVHLELRELVKIQNYSRIKTGKLSMNDASKINGKPRLPYTGLTPKRRNSQDSFKVKVRSEKMQKLWDYIRYSPYLNFLSRHQRISLSNLVGLLNDECFLDTIKVSAWIEGVIAKALNKFPKTPTGEYIIQISRRKYSTLQGTLTANVRKGGPAHTLELRGRINKQNVTMDVDLVPCFKFTKEHWPERPFRSNVVRKNNKESSDFFIVPKKPSNANKNVEEYWRLSLQKQERILMRGYQNLKPTIKLIKKLRDSMDHTQIASYYIKTIFLWELLRNKTLWSKPLSYVFMTMLEKYQKCLEKHEILNYWNKHDNLITFSEITSQDMSNRLKYMISDIKENPHDEYIVTEYLLTPEEYTDFITSN